MQIEIMQDFVTYNRKKSDLHVTLVDNSCLNSIIEFQRASGTGYMAKYPSLQFWNSCPNTFAL